MTPLRRRMIEDMRLRNLAPRTIETYVDRVAAFARHFGASPEHLGSEHIRAFLLHLVDQRASWSLVNQTRCALRFLYRTTLKRPWVDDGVACSKVPRKLPVVLSLDEVAQLFAAVAGLKHRAILMTAYAAGCGSPRSSRCASGTSTAAAWSSASARARAARTARSCSRRGC
jgi:site-specific recombinase XerD